MIDRRDLRALARWAVVLLAAYGAMWLALPRPRPATLAGRLMGPIRPLVVTVAWLRSDAAFADGDTARGFVLAEQALELAPRDPGLWSALVWRQAVELASPDREPDPERRARWLAAGLDLAERAEGVVAEPAAFARLAGDVVMLQLREGIEPPAWPGGRAALVDVARERYARALALGDSLASIGLEALERGEAERDADRD
ncbi:MAG: hypothetical protein AAFZ65_13555 [Planctomycetota bacterium]